MAGDPHIRIGNRLAVGGRACADGIYAQWDWDGQTLTVETSRIGLIPIFVFRASNEICVSGSLLYVLERTGAVELDDAALALFLRVGFYICDDTPFKNIKAMPSNATLRWTNGDCGIIQRPLLAQAASPLSRERALDAYIDAFRSSVRRRIPAEEFALPLSGGRDSRHILGELCEAKRKPAFCVTAELFPPRTNEDLKVAKLLCDQLDVPHRTVAQEAKFLHLELEKNRMTGFCTDEHAWAVSIVKYVARNATAIFDGIGGDVLSAGLFSSPERLLQMRRRDFDGLATDMLAGGESGLSLTLSISARNRFDYALAFERLRSELARHADSPNPVASFYFWNRTRREIALYTFGMYPDDVEVNAPYVDADVFDLLMSLRGELLVDHEFHNDAIKRAFPSLGAIPYALSDDDRRAARWSRTRTRAFYGRMGWDVGRYLVVERGNSMIDTGYVLARLGYLLLDGNQRRAWFDMEKLIYLVQLERHLLRIETGDGVAVVQERGSESGRKP